MSGYLVIGKIVSSHGVRGEMKVKSLSGEDANFRSAEKLVIRQNIGGNTREKKIRVLSVRGALPNLILALEGVENPEDARKYRGAEVLIDRKSARPLGEGEYYYADLEGCEVFYEGKKQGVVKSVWENANCDMLEIEVGEGRSAQVPLQDQFVGDVDVDAKRIELRNDWILE